jgi:hypothetical protein
VSPLLATFALVVAIKDFLRSPQIVKWVDKRIGFGIGGELGKLGILGCQGGQDLRELGGVGLVGLVAGHRKEGRLLQQSLQSEPIFGSWRADIQAKRPDSPLHNAIITQVEGINGTNVSILFRF